MSDSDLSGRAFQMPEHAADWLESVLYAESAEGKAKGARVYRMYDEQGAACGVVDFSEHGGGHLLDSDKTQALLDAGLLKTVWPCDAGYVPEWFDEYEDDPEWPTAFECTSWCGECEPRLELTETGRAALRNAESPNV
jgi:hypothetical protein